MGPEHDALGQLKLANGFVIDRRNQELRDPSGHRVMLAPQPFAVLMHLAAHAGSLVGKEALMQAAWHGVIVTDDSLVQCIKAIRRALRDSDQRIVQTESKRGYRLVVSSEEKTGTAARALEQRISFTTSSDGTRIAYAVAGEGRPLVRAGHLVSHLEYTWSNPLLAAWPMGLARRYQFLRYDPRGWGLSDRGFTTWSLDEQVADLESVVAAAGYDRFALIGMVNAGLIAMRYAARHPERVTKLVLIAAYARGALRRGLSSRPPDVLAALARMIEDGWGSDPAIRQTITGYIYPGASVETQRAFSDLQRISCTPKEAALYWDATKNEDISAELALIRCPTLVLHSRENAGVPFEEGRLVASGIPGARFEPLDTVNCVPLAEEPAFDQAHRLIDEFLLEPATVRQLPAIRARQPPALRTVRRSTS
jgi:pimeloyl-ACP methyl ester carboxylesterase